MDAFAEPPGKETPKPTATATPPSPTKCDSPEVHAWAPLEDFATLKEACADAFKQLAGKDPKACAPGCVTVKVINEIHGFQSGFWDGLTNEVLDFVVGDECRVTRRRICRPNKPVA
jgi:hypothetical protein